MLCAIYILVQSAPILSNLIYCSCVLQIHSRSHRVQLNLELQGKNSLELRELYLRGLIELL